MLDDEYSSRLLVRLALLRQRIDALYAHVDTISARDDEDDDYVQHLVSSSSHAGWQGEDVVLWRRGHKAWAMQEACPHAAISLGGADIEDFGREFPDAPLKGPCIACPAHVRLETTQLHTGPLLARSGRFPHLRWPMLNADVRL